MILLDSLYINNGGGKILLDYLVKSLEAEQLEVYYLFDARCASDFDDIPAERKTVLKASMFNRHQFYKRKKNKFSKVFCFGNLGPTLQLKIPVYVYFHQRLYLDVPKSLNFKNQIMFKIKSYVFEKLLSHTDLVLLQTESIRQEFIRKYTFYKKNKVVVLPFYEPMSYPTTEKEKDSFVYVSSGTKHKNQANLIHAFANVYKKEKRGKLTLTIANEYEELIDLVNAYKEEGVPIVNLGFIPKENLAVIYAKTEFCIYPSLSESFGLGILEAIEGGCKIIGSDLPYMHTICNPSIAFDPWQIETIEEAIYEALTQESNPTDLKTKNYIKEIIQLLQSN
ncbi:glycosyltransferase [Empedobacter falsenii]|uniref:Glycosyltransferase n=1 Tax=Empedobacter falsenii TaxID=343874 RepID=A0ABY8V7I4_9FLAO|nr:glycosyltransferase [Empedobacter falsenii]WIH96249.1 glycosyltransferase [Empedobacter falsenii]